MRVASSSSRTVFAVCLSTSASVAGSSAPAVEKCFTFYGQSAFGPTSAACPSRCPYRATCTDDLRRSTCIQDSASECHKLLLRGQLVENWVLDADGNRTLNRTCQSCEISGCKQCVGGTDGGTICGECDDHFQSDGNGGCIFSKEHWNDVFMAVLVSLALIAVWILIDLGRAMRSETTNQAAEQHGLKMRRRAQTLMVSDEGRCIERYPLLTDLFSSKSSVVGGPGLALFMNWFLLAFALSCWLAVCALIFGPSASESADHIEPCRQQHASGAAPSESLEIQHPNGRWPYWKWALASYVGCVVLSGAFLFWEMLLWSAMVEGRHPALREYCLELSNLPRDLTSAQQIRKHLGDWMERLCLDRTGIRQISVAYDIPRHKQQQVDDLIEAHLHCVSQQLHDNNLATVSPNAATTDAGPLWVQLLALVLHQIPVDKCCCRRHKVRSTKEGQSQTGYAEARELLRGMGGSGYAYVVMDSEALTMGLAGMGALRLPNGHKVFVRKAPVAPIMVRWKDYCPISWAVFIYRIIRATVIMYLAMALWLTFFGWYLTFELFTLGNTSVSKGLMGTLVVGLLVPIGNAMFSALIDLQTEAIGFRSEDVMRLWRLILNVFINALANFGEVYLVHKKALVIGGFNLSDVPWSLFEVLDPLVADPNASVFQSEITVILWPAGILVPVFSIALLQNFLPFFVGRLRLKRDARLTAADAERIMKPPPVDLISPYSDFIVNLTLISFTFWFSPGRYHVTLWFACALWSVLQLGMCHFNVLRWQGRSYFGGQEAHRCESFLLAMPLGFLSAALFNQWDPTWRGGRPGLIYHVAVHYVFVKYVLFSFAPPKQSLGLTYDDMMKDKHAPIADYRNTNPIEVLKREYIPEMCDDDVEDMVFYRLDKWYLQPRGSTHLVERSLHLLPFKGEEEIIASGVVDCVKVEAQMFGRNALEAVDSSRAALRNVSVETASRAGDAMNRAAQLLPRRSVQW